jgi:hypothetical protein
LKAGSNGQEQGLPTSCSAGGAPFDNLFSNGKTVELMRIGRAAEWFESKGKGRLRLPPIQRSFVWRNEQVVNYWDSLMRGYPAGMMMVTRVKPDGARHFGRGLDNKTEELADTDFQLFDGQQRLTALLLGLGKGSLGHSLRLWVDIGKPKGSGDRLCELRINSTGQPFGYRSGEPNTKISADDRRAAQKNWPTTKDGKPLSPDRIFREMATQPIGQLSSAKCAIPLSYIMTRLMRVGREAIANELRSLAANNAASAGAAYIDDLLTRLHNALEAEVIVKLVDGTVLDESNYARFFARLGQGGTRLSDDELTYSLIKNHYPEVHDRVEEIVNGPGRFASEVDLVIGALRVAQTLRPWPSAQEWEQVGRPTPDRVGKLREKGSETTEPYFRSMLLAHDNAPVKLRTAIERLRSGMLYDTTANSSGLPSMLLARLPRDLLDVLLLFAFKRGEAQPWEGEDRKTLIAFVLHWLVFVADNGNAAYYAFTEIQGTTWRFGEGSVAALIRHFETKGVARHAPRPLDWRFLMEEVQQRGCGLATWTERFSSQDVAGRLCPGEALRVLSTHDELMKRALIWLQRRYITCTFPHYDPTSTRDDDLPFDFDHAIPRGLFGAHWSSNVQKRFCLSDPRDMDRFRDLRKTVGDSLGNLRWLAAADNRGRGMGQIEVERPKSGDQPSLDDHIDRPSWNKLIDADGIPVIWTEDDVATFQRLIDSRTLLLAEVLMEESGITDLINLADGTYTSSVLPGDL